MPPFVVLQEKRKEERERSLAKENKERKRKWK